VELFAALGQDISLEDAFILARKIKAQRPATSGWAGLGGSGGSGAEGPGARGSPGWRSGLGGPGLAE
jgi:hypothetical protein